MKRITTCTKGMVLTCSALAFAFVGCTSEAPKTGGIEADIVLNYNTNDQLLASIDSVDATICCDGDNPLTGQPWGCETLAPINVSTTSNTYAEDRPVVGLFKKEGLPLGSTCSVEIHAQSNDTPSTVECGGFLPDIEILNLPVIPPYYGNVHGTVVVNCVTDQRYGGIDIDGLFNQCMEYQQIVVSPTDQTDGNPIDVDVWCYDPDNEDGTDAAQPGMVNIFFVTEGSFLADAAGGFPNPNNWETCDGTQIDFTVQDNSAQPYTYGCDSELPSGFDPNTPGSPQQVTCGTVDDCLVIVTVSDDGFARGGTDPFGCDGAIDHDNDMSTPDVPDYNATAVIPVSCKGDAVCGNGLVEGSETCDIDLVGSTGPLCGSGVLEDGTTPWNGWCSTNCRLFDPCTDSPTAPPTSCDPSPDPQCQTQTCTAPADCSGGPDYCPTDDKTNGTLCDSPGSPAGTEDWYCQSGACVPIPDCTQPSDCGTDDACNAYDCVGGFCTHDDMFGEVCNTTGRCQYANQLDPDPDVAAATSCGTGDCTALQTDWDASQQTSGFCGASNLDYNTLIASCSSVAVVAIPQVDCDNCAAGSTGGASSCCAGGAACVQACMEQAQSVTCATCYTDTACAANCAGDCLTDPFGAACAFCLTNGGCTQERDNCTGYFTPMPPNCSRSCTSGSAPCCI